MSEPPVHIPAPPQRILIIKPSAIGDVVHTLPILSLLRRRFAGARIAWLVTPACAGLLEGHPLLDEVILFDRHKWATPLAAVDLVKFGHRLRQGRFDLVLDLQGLFRSGLFAWLTGAPVRVGFASAREMAPLFYTDRVEVGTTEQHAIDRYLKLARAVGCEVDAGPLQYVFPTTDVDRQRVAQLAPQGKYVVLLPGTNWPTKRWPIEKFAQLAVELQRRWGLQAVVAGGPADRPLGDRIGGAVNLAGKTSLRELVALLERAALVVANDSGPMHIAAALGRPLVAPFGPTNPVRTGPYQRQESVIRLDIPCSPCYSRRCSHQSCLKWLEIEPVLTLAEQQMHRTP